MGHLHRGKLLLMARARDAALEAGSSREDARAAAYACMAPSSARRAAVQRAEKRASAKKVRKGGTRRGAKKA